ncbi:M14 family metallopeptidase [Jatrophihabitans fulvus]
MRALSRVLAIALLTVTSAVAVPSASATPADPALIGSRVIGHSVQGRPIVAYHLGNPRLRPTLVLGQMHGDEWAGVRVAKALVHGRPIRGLNLWVVPSMNPDGRARGVRQNARGVDLNRNFSYRWARLTGYNYSGPRPLSEPESRAVWRFVTTVRPYRIVSLHQPLYGVDSGDGGARDPAFHNRLARNLALPVKRFVCWSECHGSLTRTVSARRLGIAITVEFGARPSGSRLAAAPGAIVRAMGGRFG